MKVELNIDSATIGSTVEAVFAQLSDEDKKQLAKEIMLGVLREPMAAERAAHEREVVQRLMSKPDHYGRPKTEAEVVSSWEFRTETAKFVSSRERLATMICEAGAAHYKALVEDLVKNDEQTQAIFSTAREQMVKALPQIIQAAMVANFVAQLGQLGRLMDDSYNLTSSLGLLAGQTQQALRQLGLQVSLPGAPQT